MSTIQTKNKTSGQAQAKTLDSQAAMVYLRSLQTDKMVLFHQLQIINMMFHIKPENH
jgi:hypothetical protein